ncbi:GMP synthase [glutamine-hydrolyzing] [Posidoniimonas polymericola]|uniref:GMP synthase [glutamine-hydrolyzing] n=1 Tax=Posidoniimonas polymericola TaxID=2528002 RepID=A0A5C5YM79_9BACT|nr:type 1 glutamine amidotransferase [Posidoniimonas polymericola]TWT75929.1 GMP synthase [glutamine-hydrolyzing] [Posidoniimonas polymericola]
MSLSGNARFLLLQVRNEGDPIIGQEINCFAAALGCDASRVTPQSVLGGFPSQSLVDQHDAVLIGGSGDYSAAGEGEWLERILDGLRLLHDQGKPTFASCWGFQAFARAIGGCCEHDPANAELGNVELTLTEHGRQDPVFGALPPRFLGFAGHEDHVTRLPPDAVLLASTDRVPEQAYTFADKPIYATQFHPELTRDTILQRLAAYPRYVEQFAGMTLAELTVHLQETPEANGLLSRFVESVLA